VRLLASLRVGRERSSRGVNAEAGNGGVLKVRQEDTCTIRIDFNATGFRLYWKWRRDNGIQLASFPVNSESRNALGSLIHDI
jgi:predicted secreted protein